MHDYYLQRSARILRGLLLQIGVAIWMATAAVSLVLAKPAPEVGVASPASAYEEGAKRMSEGDFAGAVIHFKNVLQEDHNHLPARIALGRANLRLGNALGAVKELRITPHIAEMVRGSSK